jgi:ATP-dependent Clp protease adaptor protein ClpS
MSQAATAELDAPDQATAPPAERPAPKAAPHRRPRTQPPYAVILHNDDHNGMDHVIRVLCKVFRFDDQTAFERMLEAHTTGRSLLWSGMREHAELKAEQVHACGADPATAEHGAGRLRVTVEPMPD